MNTKKIAFITFGHWGSTLPLAKCLSDHGYTVDYYIECFQNKVDTLEATDTQVFYINRLVGVIQESYLGSLIRYCPKVSFRYIRLVSPLDNHRFISLMPRIINRLLILHFSLGFNRNGYENVILVGRNTASHFVFYHKYFKANILTCLHEVTYRNKPYYTKPSYLLRYLFRHDKRIIVHSKNALNGILRFPLCKKDNVYRISFGLFKTWEFCKKEKVLESSLGYGYFLFIGGIDEYKGLDVLLDAINVLKGKNAPYRFVIAGSGKNDVIRSLEKVDGVSVINRFLSNNEFATLLGNSYAVICPYKSMSQSGIPQSAFVFHKPVIASDLKGFCEIVKDNITGLIFKSEDSTALADTIDRISDREVYDRLVNNLSHFEEIIPEMNWETITASYISLFN